MDKEGSGWKEGPYTCRNMRMEMRRGEEGEGRVQHKASYRVQGQSPSSQLRQAVCDVHCRSVLKLGASRPWREAMQLMTGQQDFDAGPMMEYFEPLISWLRTQNNRHRVGWL